MTDAEDVSPPSTKGLEPPAGPGVSLAHSGQFEASPETVPALPAAPDTGGVIEMRTSQTLLKFARQQTESREERYTYLGLLVGSAEQERDRALQERNDARGSARECENRFHEADKERHGLKVSRQANRMTVLAQSVSFLLGGAMIGSQLTQVHGSIAEQGSGNPTLVVGALLVVLGIVLHFLGRDKA